MSVIATFVGAYMVLVALMLGSFINMAADRIPRGESVIHPRSHCRSCGRQLNVIDLLPIIGYTLRGGRCASCKTSIGFTAPVVEAVSGGLMLAPILWLGVWPGAVIGLALVTIWGALVTGAAFRWRHREAAAE